MNITIILLIIISMCDLVQNDIVSIEKITPFVNKRIRQYVNKLFHYLKIERGYRRYYKIKILLKMYDNLNSAIEFNWKVYAKIKKVVAVANNISDNIIYKVLGTALQKDNELNNSTTQRVKKATENNKFDKESEKEKDLNIKLTNTRKPNATHTDEWDNEILDKFYEKINNLTLEDLTGEPVNKTHLQVNEDTLYKLPKRLNMDLQEWDPKEYSEGFMRRSMGTTDLIEKYPFIASVHVMDQFACTGSIISIEAVITAASCLPVKIKQRLPHSITVRVGSDFADKQGVMLAAKYVEFHPQYEPASLKNNLAIIRIQGNDKMQILKHKHLIKKINLDVEESPLRKVQVLGYRVGSIYVGDKRLVVGDLEVLPLHKCTTRFLRNFGSTANFCGGELSKSKATMRSSQCNTDLGSPAVTDKALAGLVSCGGPVCGKNPTVFTKISFHYRWIRYVIGQKWKGHHSQLPPARIGHMTLPPQITRMYYEYNDDDPTSTTVKNKKMNIKTQSDLIFDEIREILNLIGDPFSVSFNLIRKNDKDKKKYMKEGIEEDDDPFKYLLEETKATPVENHPLYNKSFVPMPGVHYTTTTPQTTKLSSTAFTRPDIGLPSYIPYHIIQNYVDNSEELDYYLKNILHDKGIHGLIGRQGHVTRAIPHSYRATIKNAVFEITRNVLWDKNFQYFPRSVNNARRTNKP